MIFSLPAASFPQYKMSECAWTSDILEEKRDGRRHSTTGFCENVVVEETTKLANVRSFIILWLGEGLTSIGQ